jgi:hypothetical protein
MADTQCDNCHRNFHVGDSIYICQKCGARLCVTCSAGGKTDCPKCIQQRGQFTEIKYRP